MVAEALIAWLLDSDPALRWQVERDLVGEPPEVWEATRRRIATEGFGARLLALQDPDGQWAGGAFFPSDFDFHGPEAAEGAGQPWTATTWTLNSLRSGASTPLSCASAARPNFSLRTAAGSTRPAVLERRGRLLHQRLDGRERSVARRRYHRHRRLVPRASTVRRRLELRVGRGLYAIVVPLDAELPQGTARLRRRDRRHGRDARCPALRRGIPPAARALSPSLDRRTGGTVGGPLRLPVPLVLQRAQRGRVLPAGFVA